MLGNLHSNQENNGCEIRLRGFFEKKTNFEFGFESDIKLRESG